MKPSPPKRKSSPPPKKPKRPSKDAMAHLLARSVQDAHGEDQAATFDQSEDLGSPRGYIGTRNIALDRVLGTRLPLGRVVEFFGLNASGKSTAADQVGSQCQAEGGLYGVADTERNRSRSYMRELGVNDMSTVWIGGRTVEEFFEQLETIARTTASLNLMAWKIALDLAGFKTANLPIYAYNVYDPFIPKKDRKKPIKKFMLYTWSMEHAVALKKYQIANGLNPSGVRDEVTRNHLKPVVLYTGDGSAWSDQDTRKRELRDAITTFRETGEVGDLPCHYADRPTVIAWDSVGGTPTKVESEESAADLHVGLHARAIKQNLRRLIQILDDAAILLVAVNQVYHMIGQQGHGGPKMNTFGGEGLKFHSCIRVEFKKIGVIKLPDDAIIGQIVNIRVVKNKLAPPFREEQFGLIFGRGADNAWAIYYDLNKRGIIKAGGGWSWFEDPSIQDRVASKFRGWMALANMMANDGDLYDLLAGIYMEGGR